MKDILNRDKFKFSGVLLAVAYAIAFVIARQSFLSDPEYAHFVEIGINTEGSFYPWYRKPLPEPKGDELVFVDFRDLYLIESDRIGGVLVTILIALAGFIVDGVVDRHLIKNLRLGSRLSALLCSIRTRLFKAVSETYQF